MFQTEQKAVEEKIRVFATSSGLPDPGEIQWSPIPFNGQWGISTSFFQLAAQEARLAPDGGPARIPVPQRAQEMAAAVAQVLMHMPGYSQVEAVKGYLNLYFSPGEYAKRVVDTVLEQADQYGHGQLKHQQVMVEYSQPNTHKGFHVGHLRNMILGSAICNILEYAGYQVIRTTYPSPKPSKPIAGSSAKTACIGTSGSASMRCARDGSRPSSDSHRRTRKREPVNSCRPGRVFYGAQNNAFPVAPSPRLR